MVPGNLTTTTTAAGTTDPLHTSLDPTIKPMLLLPVEEPTSVEESVILGRDVLLEPLYVTNVPRRDISPMSADPTWEGEQDRSHLLLLLP